MHTVQELLGGGRLQGVETKVDWHLLREIGCDLAQGYFIAPPMASDRLAAWLEDWKGQGQRLSASRR